MFDFNNAAPQRPDVIPDGTFVPLRMRYKEGGYSLPGADGDEGLFRKSKSSETVMLECEFEVTGGRYAEQKFYQFLTVKGQDDKGWNITSRTIRAMLESAYNIQPSDVSESATARRNLQNLRSIDGIEFFGKITIEQSEGWPDKNKLDRVVTPDQPEYALLVAGKEVPPKPRSASSRPRAEALQAKPMWRSTTDASGQPSLPSTYNGSGSQPTSSPTVQQPAGTEPTWVHR